MSDRLKHIWMLYRKPVLLNVVTVIIYILLDGPTTEGSRTPMPPMNAWEKILFMAAGVSGFVSLLWIILIALSEHYRDKNW